MSAPTNLRVEHLDGETLGVGERRPRLSWQLPDGCTGQQTYTVEIDGQEHGPVPSPDHVLVAWPGEEVTSRKQVSWRVRVTTEAGESAWSEPASFEAGLLDPADWSANMVGRVAAASERLGEDGDAARYREVEALARADFAERYVHADGAMTSDSQTAYSLAIRFGLVDGDRLAAAGERLVALVEAEGHRIGTGFAGTPVVCDALCDVGAVDTAYRLLLQTESPSWLYPVLQGATTIWERWDGIRPDGTRNPGEMNSFNHYALGAVADWLHRRVAGLAPAEPGYRRPMIKPLPGAGLDHATARLDTPYGRAEAGWRRDGAEVVVHAVVAPGTTATVELPDGSAAFDAGVGAHEWRCAG